METTMDLTKIFVYVLQRDLRNKILRRDKGLRVLAIPELNKFFMPPISLDDALKLYEKCKGLRDLKGSHGQLVITVCGNCGAEVLRVDGRRTSDSLPKGWIKRKIEENMEFFCSRSCADKRTPCLVTY